MLILERPPDSTDWRLLGTAANADEVDSMTGARPGSFLIVDPEKQTVTAFRRSLRREAIAPTP